MFNIKKNQIIVEMDRNALWTLGTALKNGVVNETKIKWINYFNGESEIEFVNYVKIRNKVIFDYLEEIFSYLNRGDIIESVTDELYEVFRTKLRN